MEQSSISSTIMPAVRLALTVLIVLVLIVGATVLITKRSVERNRTEIIVDTNKYDSLLVSYNILKTKLDLAIAIHTVRASSYIDTISHYETRLNKLKSNNDEEIYFVNNLDADSSVSYMSKWLSKSRRSR